MIEMNWHNTGRNLFEQSCPLPPPWHSVRSITLLGIRGSRTLSHPVTCIDSAHVYPGSRVPVQRFS